MLHQPEVVAFNVSETGYSVYTCHGTGTRYPITATCNGRTYTVDMSEENNTTLKNNMDEAFPPTPQAADIFKDIIYMVMCQSLADARMPADAVLTTIRYYGRDFCSQIDAHAK